MKKWGPVRVLVAVLGLALGIGGRVALPRVAHELPASVAGAARLPPAPMAPE
jgi:hypothetical protein